jgi:hypothetical protein
MELWSGAYFSCLLAHVFPTYVILHKTTTCSFNSAKELNNLLYYFKFSLNFFVLLQNKLIRNLILPIVEPGSNHWYRFRHLWKCDFFSISTSSIVKESKPAAEPHGSLQGCTVRPKKGAGQCSTLVNSVSRKIRDQSDGSIIMHVFVWTWHKGGTALSSQFFHFLSIAVLASVPTQIQS